MEVTKANLATYLAGLTPSVTPYPIKITETVASDWGNSNTAGTVGSIIRASTPSGVTLNLGLTIIPSSVTTMNSSFRSCTSLTTAPVIPSSVSTMSYTFYGCTSLTTAPVIPNSVMNLYETFDNCTSLTTAPIIPSSVTNMVATFYECISLTTAPIIPSSVTYMGGTFYGCTSLHTIQNFAVDVDNCDMTNAFQNCPALANIYVTTLSESSWHLLHTNTGATGTDYTIYNPDGTVAGSGTVAGTSQVLTLYGKSDELVISANITPTLAKETATSQVQWHKSGLPYDDELMIFNAKNPDTVISNFITVNRAGEEFLGKSKDSYPIPTDAVLQYSFDEIKQLPDNPAGTVYKKDNDWTTVDGWFNGHTSITLSVENQSLKAVYNGTRPDTGLSIGKSGLTYNGKLIVGRIKSTVPIVSIGYYNGTVVVNLKLTNQNAYETVFYGYMQSAYTTALTLYMNFKQLTAKTCWIESLYIGDGSYLEPVIDNSYSESHAENHGVIPVDGVCGKAGYFNNSYMIAPRPALGDDITIYFWAKFDALGIQTIVQSRTVEGKGLSVFQIDSSYRLGWRGNNSSFTGYTTPVNTWHHVCIKMNSTTAVLKINGELKSTLTGTYGTTTYLASNIWSGLSGTGGTLSGQILTGALDGLKIVPRFTTDDEDTGEYKARANHPKFYATAQTATKLATARKIGSANFDGSADIRIDQILGSKRKKAVICVGDSYNLTTEWWTGWGEILASLVSGTDTPVYSYAAPGGGFVAAAETYSFLTALQNHAYGTAVTDKYSITDIVVLGGYNDMMVNASESAMETAIANFMSYCTTNFPNATVTIGLIGVDFNSAVNQGKLATYAEIYDQKGARHGAKTCSNFKHILKNRSKIFISAGNANSGFHPSTAGNTQVAVCVLKFFREGHFDVKDGIDCCGAYMYQLNGDVRISVRPYINSSFPRLGFLSMEMREKTYPFDTWVEVCSTINSEGACVLWGAVPEQSANWDGFIYYAVGSGNSAITIASTLQFKLEDKKIYAKQTANSAPITITGSYFVGGFDNLYFDSQLIY